MMPVAASMSKKPSSFTIDSLMGRGRDSRESSPVRESSPTPSPREARTVRSPRGSSPDRPAHTASSGFQPVVPGMGAAAAAFLHGINAVKGHNGQFDPHPSDLPMHLTAEGLHSLHPGLGTAVGGHMGLPSPLQCGTGGMPLGLANSAAHQLGMHHLLLGHHRESLGPYFPWFLSRHGNLLSHRFAGPDASLLLQPFRKPKRIRTAFSPSQLLRLEHAFEKNHYVVGQERKDLASNLSLTETQVKVWFQNRRTKYKRMKAEDEEKGGSPEGGGVAKTGEPMETGPSSPLSPASEDDLLLDSSDEDSQGLHAPSPGHPAGLDINPQNRSKTSHHINRWRVETNQV